jgi:hypothetical protein
MLTEQDKRRIEAEEEYRAKVRASQKPVKTEGFTDKLNRVRLWAAIILAVLILIFGFWLTSGGQRVSDNNGPKMETRANCDPNSTSFCHLTIESYLAERRHKCFTSSISSCYTNVMVAQALREGARRGVGTGALREGPWFFVFSTSEPYWFRSRDRVNTEIFGSNWTRFKSDLLAIRDRLSKVSGEDETGNVLDELKTLVRDYVRNSDNIARWDKYRNEHKHKNELGITDNMFVWFDLSGLEYIQVFSAAEEQKNIRELAQVKRLNQPRF